LSAGRKTLRRYRVRVVVCIKQVPDTSEVKINPETNTLMREGVASIVNPFDEYAVEEGIRIKEKLGGETIVVTMGPPQADEALKTALAMGCDKGYLVSDRAFAGSDTWATANTLAGAIRKIEANEGPVDIVICGKQAIDGDTGQVGPGIAVRLNLPPLTYVSKVREIDPDKKTIIVERMMERGKEVVKSALPVLLTVVKDINAPRYPSLFEIKKASKKPLIKLSFSDLGIREDQTGLKGSPTWVNKIFTPDLKSVSGEIFQGDPEECAVKLAGRILELKKGVSL
jgi:electron transfer flavoprotein beta subunit